MTSPSEGLRIARPLNIRILKDVCVCPGARRKIVHRNSFHQDMSYLATVSRPFYLFIKQVKLTFNRIISFPRK